MTLEFDGPGADAFAATTPGQFAEFDLSGLALPAEGAIPQDLRDQSKRELLLRRPFSFSKVDTKGGRTTVDVLYCVLGSGTVRMTTLRRGDVLNVIGPLGNGFSVPDGKKLAILAAGGMGAPPIQHMAEFLTRRFPTIQAIAFVGAKSKDALPYSTPLDSVSQEIGFSLREFANHGIDSCIATDDGSCGFAGTVTDCLAQWLDSQAPDAAETIIYACGPEKMLAAVARMAADRHIDCQVSMERMMACGIGLCQSCAVECKSSGQTEYRLCCKDGPVFNAKEVLF
jgi:dihydroorotate dehydrogenase electron transfer subunit